MSLSAVIWFPGNERTAPVFSRAVKVYKFGLGEAFNFLVSNLQVRPYSFLAPLYTRSSVSTSSIRTSSFLHLQLYTSLFGFRLMGALRYLVSLPLTVWIFVIRFSPSPRRFRFNQSDATCVWKCSIFRRACVSATVFCHIYLVFCNYKYESFLCYVD